MFSLFSIGHAFLYSILILLHYSPRQLSSMSPSGKLQAIVRKVPGKNGQEEKQFLEVDCIMIDIWGSRV